jgi:hypothetical protein
VTDGDRIKTRFSSRYSDELLGRHQWRLARCSILEPSLQREPRSPPAIAGARAVALPTRGTRATRAAPRRATTVIGLEARSRPRHTAVTIPAAHRPLLRRPAVPPFPNNTRMHAWHDFTLRSCPHGQPRPHDSGPEWIRYLLLCRAFSYPTPCRL